LLLPYEVEDCHDVKQLHLSAFLYIAVNSGFHLLFKHSTLPCTIDQLFTVLRIGPWKSQDSINITLPVEGTLLNFLLLGNDVYFHSVTLCLPAGSWCCTHVSLSVKVCFRKAAPSWYHCKSCTHIFTCACLC
jgi:hypothetical protein